MLTQTSKCAGKQGLEQQLGERTRTLADVESAREAQRREWEAKCKGLQDDSKAMENSWKSKVDAALGNGRSHMCVYVCVCAPASLWFAAYLQVCTGCSRTGLVGCS